MEGNWTGLTSLKRREVDSPWLNVVGSWGGMVRSGRSFADPRHGKWLAVQLTARLA